MPFHDLTKEALERRFQRVEYHDERGGYWIYTSDTVLDEELLDYLMEAGFGVHQIDFEVARIHVSKISQDDTRFTGRVQQANQYGSKQVTIPRDVQAPGGADIAIGDSVALAVISVEKEGETE